MRRSCERRIRDRGAGRGAHGASRWERSPVQKKYSGPSVKTKIGRGIFKVLGGVIEVGDQFFGGIAASLGAVSHGASVFRDGELEVAPALGFFHVQDGALILHARVAFPPLADAA